MSDQHSPSSSSPDEHIPAACEGGPRGEPEERPGDAGVKRTAQEAFDRLVEEVARDGLAAAEDNIYVDLHWYGLDPEEQASLLSLLSSVCSGLSAIPNAEAHRHFPKAASLCARLMNAAADLKLHKRATGTQAGIDPAGEDAAEIMAVMREVWAADPQSQKETVVVLMVMMGAAWQTAAEVEAIFHK
ncbi:hypothetical protein [Streptomyces sp. NBC_01244]|uniref:hypothetical protein n=1 Tax=Streptomyces sp. NBC_01244 TaxID=2903797 RepID=UPI002E105527|nr:hypothetical protein OG247_44385 [Streptomyces sp. NBC_01244]